MSVIATLQRAGESWDPCSTNLLRGVIAGPENACVQSKGHDGRDVVDVNGALSRTLTVVSPYVGVMDASRRKIKVLVGCCCCQWLMRLWIASGRRR